MIRLFQDEFKTAARRASLGATRAVSFVKDGVIGNTPPEVCPSVEADLSFLDDETISDARKEALYRITVKETFTTPFPKIVDDLDSFYRNKSGEVVNEETKTGEEEKSLFIDEQHDLESIKTFLNDFMPHTKTEEILKQLEEHSDTLGVYFEELVPVHVSYKDFWSRFFYRCDEKRIEQVWEAERLRNDESIVVKPFRILTQSSKYEFIGTDVNEFVEDFKEDTTLVREDVQMINTDIRTFVGDITHDTVSVVYKFKDSASAVLSALDAKAGSPVEQQPNRAELEKQIIMGMEECYLTPLLFDDMDDSERHEVVTFLNTFNLTDKTEEIISLLENHTDTVGKLYYQLVPLVIGYEVFWQRYFYRCDRSRIERWLIQDDEVRRQARARTYDTVRSVVVRAPSAVVNVPIRAAKEAVSPRTFKAVKDIVVDKPAKAAMNVMHKNDSTLRAVKTIVVDTPVAIASVPFRVAKGVFFRTPKKNTVERQHSKINLYDKNDEEYENLNDEDELFESSQDMDTSIFKTKGSPSWHLPEETLDNVKKEIFCSDDAQDFSESSISTTLTNDCSDSYEENNILMSSPNCVMKPILNADHTKFSSANEEVNPISIAEW